MLKVYGAFRSANFEYTRACAGCVSRERYFTGTKGLAYWYKSACLLVQKELLTGTKVRVLTCKRYKSAYVSIRQRICQHTSAYVSVLVSTCGNTDMQKGFGWHLQLLMPLAMEASISVFRYKRTCLLVHTYLLTGTKVLCSRQVTVATATRDGGFDICVQALPLSLLALLVQNYNVSSDSCHSPARWRVWYLCACMLTYADVCWRILTHTDV
jgi:hypothetical protein